MLGLRGHPRRVFGTFLLLRFKLSGSPLPRLLHPLNARVDPLANVCPVSGLRLTLRLAPGLGKPHHLGLLLVFAELELLLVTVVLRLYSGVLRLEGRRPGDFATLWWPGPAVVDRGLVLPFDCPADCCGVGLELAPPLDQAVRFIAAGFGSDPAAVQLLAGRAGRQAVGLMLPVPGIPDVLGVTQLVRLLDLLGGRGAGIAGKLHVAVCLGLLGLPLQPCGLLAIVVKLPGHIRRRGRRHLV